MNTSRLLHLLALLCNYAHNVHRLKRKLDSNSLDSPVSQSRVTPSSIKKPPPPPATRSSAVVRPPVSTSTPAGPLLPTRTNSNSNFANTSTNGTSSNFEGIFTNLSQADKEAFFDLLDEYFTSRPELFQDLLTSYQSNGTAPTNESTVTSSVATAAATAALRNPSLATSAAKSYGMSDTAADRIGKFGANHAETLGKAVGTGISTAAASQRTSPPSPPPVKSAFTPSAKEYKPPSGLTTGKKWGNMDTSSKTAVS